MIFSPNLYIFHHWISFTLFTFILVKNRNNNNFLYIFLIGLSYFPLLEALGRLHKLDPFVPWEWGKYYSIFSFLILIINNKLKIGNRTILAIAIIVITIIKGNTTFKLFLFNSLISVSLLLLHNSVSSFKLSEISFFKILKYTTLPLLVFLISSVGELSEFQLDDLQLESNNILEKIPSNQVSTYMGLGVFMLFLFIITKNYLLDSKLLTVSLAILMLVVGLITFSRGGVIVAIICVILSYFFSRKITFSLKYLLQFIILTMILIFIVTIINVKTKGNLLLRYTGETQGTILGSKEKNFNSLTTNRFKIFSEDIDVFVEHWLIGVEVGRSSEYRDETFSQLSHIEVSRLLAENGVVGFIIVIIWFKDIFYWRRKKLNYISLSIYIIGFLTTFHGAMRTSVPFIMMLISFVNIYEKRQLEITEK